MRKCFDFALPGVNIELNFADRSKLMEEFSPANISVLLVDSHIATIDGLAADLSKRPNLLIAGVTDNIEEAVSFCQTHRSVDIVIASLYFTQTRNIACAIQPLKQAKAKVIVYAGDERPQIASFLMRSGAAAFLSQSDSYQTIYRVILSVSFGTMGYVSRKLTEATKLTAVEQDILGLIARGLKYDEIASLRNTSAHTVRKQCGRLQVKVGVESRERLIVWAVNSGFGVVV